MTTKIPIKKLKNNKIDNNNEMQAKIYVTGKISDVT